MIIITGSAELGPDNREEGLRLGREHSARSRSEPGCIAHNCFEDAETPGRLHFFEKWEDMAAVQVHFAVPASGEFVRRLSALAQAEPTIEIYAADRIEFPAR